MSKIYQITAKQLKIQQREACISQMIDKHAPLKRLSRKQQKLVKKPWITKGILTSIRKKIPSSALCS